MAKLKNNGSKRNNIYYLFKKQDGDENLYDDLKGVESKFIEDKGLMYCVYDSESEEDIAEIITELHYNKESLHVKERFLGDFTFNLVVDFDMELCEILNTHTVLRYSLDDRKFYSVDLGKLQDSFDESVEEYDRQIDLIKGVELDNILDSTAENVANMIVCAAHKAVPKGCNHFTISTFGSNDSSFTFSFYSEDSIKATKSQKAIYKSKTKDNNIVGGFICNGTRYEFVERLYPIVNSIYQNNGYCTFAIFSDRHNKENTMVDVNVYSLVIDVENEPNIVESETIQLPSEGEDFTIGLLKLTASEAQKILIIKDETLRDKLIYRGVTESDVICTL